MIQSLVFEGSMASHRTKIDKFIHERNIYDFLCVDQSKYLAPLSFPKISALDTFGSFTSGANNSSNVNVAIAATT